METAIGLDLAAGYPRSAVETEFRTKLTEQQWRILISELWAEDEFDVEATITDVMSNLASFEAEYKAWNEQIANRRNDSDGD